MLGNHSLKLLCHLGFRPVPSTHNDNVHYTIFFRCQWAHNCSQMNQFSYSMLWNGESIIERQNYRHWKCNTMNPAHSFAWYLHSMSQSLQLPSWWWVIGYEPSQRHWMAKTHIHSVPVTERTIYSVSLLITVVQKDLRLKREQGVHSVAFAEASRMTASSVWTLITKHTQTGRTIGPIHARCQKQH